jgi:CBS-domain-containing membrane protein
MQAEDVMTRTIVSVDPGMPIGEIAKLMLERGISAVPVVDGSGQLIGMVSEGDLMRRTELATEKQRSWWLRMFVGDDYLAHEFVKSHGLKARDVMTRTVVTVDEATPVAEIVNLLEEHRIKRVPVMRDGKLVGLVSRANLLHALASAQVEPARSAGSDRAIQARIVAALKSQPWWSKRNCSVIVTDGVAHLWGNAESPEEREAFRVTAETTPGVRAVKNHVNVLRPMSLFAN